MTYNHLLSARQSYAFRRQQMVGARAALASPRLQYPVYNGWRDRRSTYARQLLDVTIQAAWDARRLLRRLQGMEPAMLQAAE
jgi:hypothetical protein